MWTAWRTRIAHRRLSGRRGECGERRGGVDTPVEQPEARLIVAHVGEAPRGPVASCSPTYSPALTLVQLTANARPSAFHDRRVERILPSSRGLKPAATVPSSSSCGYLLILPSLSPATRFSSPSGHQPYCLSLTWHLIQRRWPACCQSSGMPTLKRYFFWLMAAGAFLALWEWVK